MICLMFYKLPLHSVDGFFGYRELYNLQCLLSALVHFLSYWPGTSILFLEIVQDDKGRSRSLSYKIPTAETGGWEGD